MTCEHSRLLNGSGDGFSRAGRDSRQGGDDGEGNGDRERDRHGRGQRLDVHDARLDVAVGANWNAQRLRLAGDHHGTTVDDGGWDVGDGSCAAGDGELRGESAGNRSCRREGLGRLGRDELLGRDLQWNGDRSERRAGLGGYCLHFLTDGNVRSALRNVHLHLCSGGVQLDGLLDGSLVLLGGSGKRRSAGECSNCGCSGCTCLCGGTVAFGERIFSLGSVGSVALDVLAEVVGTHEAFVADGAGEALLAGVRSEVAGQLVRAGKPLVAAFPATRVGSLPGVRTDVRLQMRALPIGLSASFPRADVSAFLAVFSAGCNVQWAVGT